MKKLIFVFILFSVLYSCKTKEVIRYVTKVHDSITIQTVRDTILKYPAQSQKVITFKKSHLETDLAFSDASIDSTGLLNHSISNKKQIPGKVISNEKIIRDSIPYMVKIEIPKYYNIIKTITVEKKLSNFQRLLINTSTIIYTALFLLLIYIIVKNYKSAKDYLKKLLQIIK